MNNLEEFKNHILTCYPQEGCGIIIDDKFTPIENESIQAGNEFVFPEHISRTLLEQGKEYKVIHSHTDMVRNIDPRVPTYQDMINQQSTEMEWGIVHCDGENVSNILWFGPPTNNKLIDRNYIPNIQDCFTLCRDYYFQEYKLDVGSFPREIDWESENKHIMEEPYLDFGFKPLEKNIEFEKGDVLIFTIGSIYPNHLGIYINDDEFLHHLYNKKSCYDSITRWKKNLIKVMRWEEVIQ